MRLGTFAAGELAFLRELLQDEGIAHREESLPGHGGAVRSELWVTSLEHARALALVAEAQCEAEAAAYRETEALAAERERAPEEKARGSATITSSRGVRILGGLLATLILVLVLIGMLGARYGTRAPTPGHNGKTIACRNRFQVVCF